jgi:hypothetical protein
MNLLSKAACVLVVASIVFLSALSKVQARSRIIPRDEAAGLFGGDATYPNATCAKRQNCGDFYAQACSDYTKAEDCKGAEDWGEDRKGCFEPKMGLTCTEYGDETCCRTYWTCFWDMMNAKCNGIGGTCTKAYEQCKASGT